MYHRIQQAPGRVADLVYFSIAALVIACSATNTAAQPGPPAMPVQTASIVEREVPPSVKLVGTVHEDKIAVVAAEVEGLIAAFEADEGQFLRANDVICRIDPTVAELRLAEANARLASLQARLEELENGERPETIKRLEAAVEEAEAIQAKWDFEQKRIESLYNTGQSSDKELNDAQKEYIAASRRLAQANASLELARNGERPEVIAQARQDVAAQQAVVSRLARDLEKTEIRAPFTGAISDKRTEVGEWIDAGGAVCEFVALNTVRVRFDVPEQVIPFARTGAPATIEVEALSKTASHVIARVIPRGSTAARTFPVEVDVANEQHVLLPGMFVWAYVPAGPVGKRLMVPKDAVVARGLQKTIFVLRPGKPNGPMNAIPTNVATGLELEGLIEVRGDGLQVGDRVVTRANERLFGPTPVTPIDEPPTAQGDESTPQTSVAATSES